MVSAGQSLRAPTLTNTLCSRSPQASSFPVDVEVRGVRTSRPTPLVVPGEECSSQLTLTGVLGWDGMLHPTPPGHQEGMEHQGQSCPWSLRAGDVVADPTQGPWRGANVVGNPNPGHRRGGDIESNPDQGPGRDRISWLIPIGGLGGDGMLHPSQPWVLREEGTSRPTPPFYLERRGRRS